MRRYDPLAAKAVLNDLMESIEKDVAHDMNFKATWTKTLQAELMTVEGLCAEYGRAQREIQRVFAKDYHTTSREGRIAFASKLLDLAGATNDDIASRAVLFNESLYLFAQAADLPGVRNALKQMAAHFSIDERALLGRGVSLASTSVAAGPGKEQLHAEIALSAMTVSEAHAATNSYGSAQDFLAIAERHGALTRDDELLGKVQRRRESLKVVSEEYAKVARAFEAIAENPSDREMSLIAGKFLCFFKEDWNAGLPLLVRGSDRDLAELARRDIVGSSGSAGQIELGDAWWIVGEQAPESSRAPVLRRAAFWYQRGLADSTGFTRIRVVDRIKSLEPSDPSSVQAATDEGPFGGREERSKQAILARDAGAGPGERAVMGALQWLATAQDSASGGWSLKGVGGSKYADGATHENTSAATAMALLALQGAGNTHLKGKFQKNVAKGWQFLLKAQQPDGSLFAEGIHNSDFYTHGLCTIALCELYGMSGDTKYEGPARKAVDFCIKTQNRHGGWRYTRGADGTCTESDLSVTGWIAMALQSARMAKMHVPADTLTKLAIYLDKNQTNGGSHYGYTGPGDSEVMTAEGLVCRQYLGWPRDDARLARGADFLLTKRPTWNDRNVYYWYHATKVMRNLEGNRWESWNRAVRDLLVARQQTSGQDKGSWDPKGDRWGGDGGRIYVTSLSVLILEAPYRYPSAYSHAEGQR